MLLIRYIATVLLSYLAGIYLWLSFALTYYEPGHKTDARWFYGLAIASVPFLVCCFFMYRNIRRHRARDSYSEHIVGEPRDLIWTAVVQFGILLSVPLLFYGFMKIQPYQ